jgi:hypothetical protein
MIIGVRGTTVWSEDLNRLLPFYRDRLGLPVAIDTPGFVVLGRSDAHALALGTHSDVHGANTDSARHMVGGHQRRHQGRLEAADGRRGRVRRGSEA